MAVLEREILRGPAPPYVPAAEETACEAVSLRPRLWTRDEYYKMAEAGILRPDERVELIKGEIITMPPIGPEHSQGVFGLAQILRQVFGPDLQVREEKPITIKDSEPQPDIVIAVATDEYFDRHPGPMDIRLIIETSASSLAIDRRIKLPLYAEAGIPEYWIVNIQAAPHQLEVYREPVNSVYKEVKIYVAGQNVEPLHAPGKVIAVSQIFRRQKSD